LSTRSVRASQRDSNPSAPGWRSAPDRRGAPTLGSRSPNSSTLKELNQIHRRPDATPSELFSFCPFTQRRRWRTNAGLNDATALRLERGCVPQSGISRSTFANPRRKIFSTASAHPPAATGPADTVALRPERNLCSHPPPRDSPAPSGRHTPLLTELETLFDSGCYKCAGPDGAPVCESQRNSNPSAPGGRSEPQRRGAPTRGYVPQNVFNPEWVASIPASPPKAPEGWRTPRRFAPYGHHRERASVLDCGGPPPLFIRAPKPQLLQSCFHFARSLALRFTSVRQVVVTTLC
jgi:hypothetical protein